MSFFHDQFSSVSPTAIETLEQSVHQVSVTLDEKERQVASLEADIVNIKISFAESVLKLKTTDQPNQFSAPTYATRGAPTNSTLVARCLKGQDSVDLLEIEKLLDTPSSGLIPSHVRFKNNKMFVTLDNDVAVAKAADILNKKPDFQSRFESASKLNVLYPVVALFVNVSDTESLKKKLEHRNKFLRDQIISVKIIFTKPNSTEGHVKIFLRSKLARDNILGQKKASIFDVDYRIVPVDLNREVRRCFKCQQYGHTQKFCKVELPACGKCAGPHRTSECTAATTEWSCVNCGGPHQTGDILCAEQVKAVARYKAFLDSHK